jgi:peptide/nickel transport system substrate-binding protein
MAYPRGFAAALVAAMVALVLAAGSAGAESVLRLVPQADLKILDPFFTTANITSNHGYMVYDTLLALDGGLTPKPEMVDSYQVSADNLVWSFTLRQGLKFSDGAPVEAKDAVASIKRWAARIPAGQTMMRFTDAVLATGPRSFEIRLKQPFGPLLNALASPENPLFVMREKEGLVDPNAQITEIVGSGPFVFVKEEWAPGSKVVYRKNPDYLPRAEPADYLSGGKVVKVDRVEWSIIPDFGIATAALNSGEADIMEQPPFELLPVLEKNPDIKLQVIDRIGVQAMIRPNQLFPPFNNPKARQALLHIVDPKEYLAAMIGNPKYEIPCSAPFVCGTPSESNVGVGSFGTPDKELAKKLFAEAGYKGEPIVIMDPTDQDILHKMTLVTAAKLKEIGINVDLQAMDWSTLTSRRALKDPPEKNPGGWHIFQTTWPGLAMENPITNSAAATPCDGKNWFGWACDDEMERRRLAYLAARDPAQRKAAIDRLQERYFETVPFVPLGQLIRPVAMRKTVSGLVEGPYLVTWNVEKAP